MFYSQFILAKKGPLGTIWIAAHLERKLRKNQVTETDIGASVDSILFPEVPIALRLSGHLLLGVVRIYSRKVNYLFHDCSEALVKIKHAFHSSSVDLPPEASTAPFHSITLSEAFDFDELEILPKRDSGLQTSKRGIVDHNVSARDLITLRDQTDDETYHASLFSLDERFVENGDIYSVLGYSDEELVHEGQPGFIGSASLMQERSGPNLEEDVLPPLEMDDEMDLGRANTVDIETPPPVQMTDVVEQASPPSMQVNLNPRLEPLVEESSNPASGTEQPTSTAIPNSIPEIPEAEKLRSAVEGRDQQPLFMELQEEMGMDKDVDWPQQKEIVPDHEVGIHVAEATPLLKETPVLSGPSPPLRVDTFGQLSGSDDVLASILGGGTPALKVIGTPLEAQASVQQKRGQRKRKPVFDHEVVLSSTFMKKQLGNTADILRKRRKTPLTEVEASSLQGSFNDQKYARPSLRGLCADVNELYNSVINLSSSKPFLKNPRSPKGMISMQANEDLAHDSRVIDFEAVALEDDMGAVAVADVPLAGHNVSPVALADLPLAVAMEDDASPVAVADPPSAPTLKPAEADLTLETPMNVQEADYIHLPPRSIKNPSHFQDEIQASGSLVVEATANPEKRSFQEANSPVGILPDCHSSRALSEQTFENLVFQSDSSDGVFLAPYEDEVLEEGDGSRLRNGKLVQNKDGWSPRTRALAKYLKSIFGKIESTHELETFQPVQVSLDNLLRGRTRKEAARMYFETLVLKSKDYIQVEQSTGFADIMLSSTYRLRKEVF